MSQPPGGIPLTRTSAEPAREAAIRAAVRGASPPERANGTTRLATPDMAGALCAFLADPRVHAPIYTLPRPLTEDSVRAFITDHEDQRRRGEGLLWVTLTEAGEISGYSDLQVWPQWATGELGGALHPDRQGQGAGAEGARDTFAWMFAALGLDRICETAAPDNIRTARLLDGLGFTRMGEVTSTRPDGTTRASLVWEIDRAAWVALHGQPG